MSDWALRRPDAALADQWRAQGLWADETLGDLLDRSLAGAADRAFVVHSQMRPWEGTFGKIRALAQRLAGGLAERGFGRDDPIAFQLPNWSEAAVTFYAATFLGAPIVPIVHFYGPKELRYILGRTGVRVLVTADRFGPLDYLGPLVGMRADLPALELVGVVGEPGHGTEPFGALLGAPVDGPAPVAAEEPALVAYTSGTTADPKGVIHTHRSIGCEVRQLAAVQPDGTPPTLVGAPVGHGIGMLAALLLPVYRGDPVHLIDVWDPKVVLATMAKEGLLAGTGATFFLTSLLDHPHFSDRHRTLMPKVGLGGSTVPASVGERAEQLGISTVRLYGSTEHPSITGCTHDDPRHQRLHTDGRPLPGVEIRILDPQGKQIPPGVAGQIVSRGPDCFAGYTDPDLTAAAFDDDGWYHTGDIGVVDGDGYLTITDRLTDLIIRGGENVSAVEVEDLLLGLPGVAECAVVAVPDPRLGEHACALVRLVPGAAECDLAAVQDHLDAAGLARQKWPEELRFVTDFPRTPSGKVKKFVLRDQLRDEADR